jgi:acetyltransferase
MLGVARVILGRTLREAEFSVIVSDPWQGKGIGAALLQGCLGIARERGIQKVIGTVLSENTQMLALGRKLGFKMKREPGISDYELSIELGKN